MCDIGIQHVHVHSLRNC